MNSSTTTAEAAYNATDFEMIELAGIALVLQEVAREYDGLCNPDPMATGILTLIGDLQRRAKLVLDLHSAEWSAILQVRKGGAA